MKLASKVAVITGAALGYKAGGPSIGSAIAFLFAKQGAQVVVLDINKEMGQRTADRITASGGDALFIHTDVSSSEQIQQAVKKIHDHYGQLQCLVNCAATYQGDIFHTVVDTPEEDWLTVFDVNLHGYYRMAKYCIPLMNASGGGSIINISSIAARQVVPGFAVYHVTKAAINGLTRVLAVDHAPLIRTNAICPGFVKIANSEKDRNPEELDQWYANIMKSYPAKRLCTVDDVAETALFLATDASSYINGQCLTLDSGRCIMDAHEY
ncbi:MAG TPA: SDR family oxidoreductase [bacterium]|nr:SDR family oxidoreductase [bacterium]